MNQAAIALLYKSRATEPTSSPSELGGVKGKGEGGKVSNPLPLTPAPYPHFVGAPPSPFPSHHAAFLGWQTTTRLSQQALMCDSLVH